jgi:hypothetical protein
MINCKASSVQIYLKQIICLLIIDNLKFILLAIWLV